LASRSSSIVSGRSYKRSVHPVALLDGDAVRQGAAVLGRGDLGGVLRGGVQQERHDLA
jgi:hypothetical protein